MNYEFRELAQVSYNSAKHIVPQIINKIGIPTMVVDLGGGAGGWCKAFLEHGTTNAICIDHPSTPTDVLFIDANAFIKCDFEKTKPDPVKSDLAISIEFAEHISIENSNAIIDFLVQSAPIVIFSAAIPNQGGIRHVNEQRHDYWINKFAERDYECCDIIRSDIIFNTKIDYYLRQNIFLYVDKNSKEYARISMHKNFIPQEFEIVSTYILNKKPPFKQLLKMIWGKIIRRIKISGT